MQVELFGAKSWSRNFFFEECQNSRCRETEIYIGKARERKSEVGRVIRLN